MSSESTNGDWRETSGEGRDLLQELQVCPAFRTLRSEDLTPFSRAERLMLQSGDSLSLTECSFYALLQGSLEILKVDGTGAESLIKAQTGDTFGEVGLVLQRPSLSLRVTALGPSTLLRLPEAPFWDLMAGAPGVRESVLREFSRRFESHQAMTLHREKLISLGTLAAGLMHELNNPGTAASRAATQLRENILRLQQISLRMTRTRLEPEQLECLAGLQEHALVAQGFVTLSSLELSDREEQLSGWLEDLGIANAQHLGPILVSAGWGREDIACAESAFARGVLSDALNYIGALLSSMQHVRTIEESIARVGELVGAVKKYAYDDKQRQQSIDVRESLLSTLVILGHKFRSKGIGVEKDLPPERVLISCRGVGLSQVWTNLLDNAADAAPENGTVRVRLWTTDQEICVGIADNGPGIAPEHQENIFKAFYTTKPSGVGTGLGLDIVQRIVREKFHGHISFSTQPGKTEFVVHLPLAGNAGNVDGDGCWVALRPDEKPGQRLVTAEQVQKP